MREILFKAKDKKTDHWVEGLYHIQTKILAPGLASDFHVITRNDGETFWIDKETLCQYTGEEDENCNKIFEDDLIDCRVRGQCEDCRSCEDCYFIERVQVCFAGGSF